MLRSAKIAAEARDAGRFGVRIDGGVEVDLQAVRQRARDVVEAQSGEGAAPFERIGIRVLLEEARLTREHVIETASGERIHADRVVLATGTEATVPPIPAWPRPRTDEQGGDPEARARAGRSSWSAPARIGIEFAQITRGSAPPSPCSRRSHVLPLEDDDAAAAFAPAFEAEGMRPRRRHDRGAEHDGGWTVALAGGEALRADELLVATGRQPVFDVHDLPAAGVTLHEEGVRPDRDAPHDEPGCGRRATPPASCCSRTLARTRPSWSSTTSSVDRGRGTTGVPRVTATGSRASAHRARGARGGPRGPTALLRLADNERAHIDGRTEGVVKLVGDARTGEVLGGHIVGRTPAR
jgi:mercuric reductase